MLESSYLLLKKMFINIRENPSPEEAKHHIGELIDKLDRHLAIKGNPAHEK